MGEWLKWLVAGKELRALNRYRKACHLAYRWNGRLPNSAETAEWIQAVGEDLRGADIEQFRDRLRNNAKVTRPAPSEAEVLACAMRILAADRRDVGRVDSYWDWLMPVERENYLRMARAALGVEP